MKKEQLIIIIGVLIVICLSPFFCYFLTAAESTEPELVGQAAERDFPRFLEAVWESKVGKKDFGFQAADKIEEVKLAKPIRIYEIVKDTIQEMKDIKSLVSVVKPGNWFFPVEIKGEYRAIFLVTKRNGNYKGSGLQSSPNFSFCHALQKLRQIWSDKGEDTFRLVSCFDPMCYFYIVTSVAEPNFTPLIGGFMLAGKRWFEPPADLSLWMPASKTILELKRFWAKGLRWGPFGGLD